MKVEKEGPSITYESFVEELDEGDAFTTTIIDVLVKVRAASYCIFRASSKQVTLCRNWLSASKDLMSWTVG